MALQVIDHLHRQRTAMLNIQALVLVIAYYLETGSDIRGWFQQPGSQASRQTWVGFVIGPGFLPRDYPTIAASLGIGMWRESLSRYKDQVAIALIAEQHCTRG
jgi:hypothetical protein